MTTASARANRAIAALWSLFERRPILVACGYSALFIVICLGISATKPMWFDELATYYPAKLPVADMFRFFREGMDVHTPAASLVLRGALAVFGDHHATNRLPFALGFLLMCVCVFRFVSLRCPVAYAAGAMIFPVVTGVGYYATELRCYGLELGAVGVALVSWQEAARGSRRPLSVALLFLSLAAAISCHYYAALVWIPFGVAELMRFRKNGRFDIPVLAALAASPFPLLYFLPAIRAAKANYAAGIWSRPHLGMIVDTYRDIFALAFAPMFIVVVLWILLRRFHETPEGSFTGPTAEERALGGCLALLPAIGVPLSFLAGGFVGRYVLASAAGLAIFLAFGICRALKSERLAGILLATVFAGWFAYKGVTKIKMQAAANGGFATPIAAPLQNAPWMRVLEETDTSLPVAVVPAVFFLQMQHYAPKQVRGRMVYLSSEKYALQFEGIYTGETNLIQFARLLPVHVADYDTFVTANRHFLICAETTNATWLLEKLRADNAHIELRKRLDTHFVFEAFLPEGAAGVVDPKR